MADIGQNLLILIYNVLFLAAAILAFPVMLVNVLTSAKRKRTFVKRLAIQPPLTTSRKRPVWVHALSVGEVLASVPLVKAIRKTAPDRPLVFSISTWTGRRIAQEALGKDIDGLFFFPYDLLWSVRKAIQQVNPMLFFLVESDIWPNMLFELNRQQVPVVLVNGRISQRSFRGYKRFSFFMRHMFSWMSVICVQSRLDADRLAAIGVLGQKVRITGNIKFDQPVDRVPPDDIESTKKSMKIDPDKRVWLAGSTHAGEEAMLLRVFCRLKKAFDRLVLVIVPRDPERAEGVCRLAHSRGLTGTSLGDFEKAFPADPVDVIVVDRIGMLGRLYALADIAFVGGSLVEAGGHNPLEPAAFARPIVFGPDMSDFSSISDMLVAHGGAVRVTDGQALFEQLAGLLRHPLRLQAMGEKAREVFEGNKGAVEKTLKACGGFLHA